MIRRGILIWGLLTALAVSPDLSAVTKKSELLTQEAWTAWGKNNRPLVEQKFQAAIAADSTNTRAYLGLSMLYDLQEDYTEAWRVFRHVLRTADNKYPYLFAEWITPMVNSQYDTPASGMVDLLEALLVDKKADGFVKAEANQFLGDYYQRHGDLEKANRYYRAMRMITDWKLTGPFDNLSASGFAKVFPPETAYDPDAVYEGKNGIPARWFSIDAYDNYFWINFQHHFPQTDAVFYANTYIYSPTRQAAQLRIGTSGALKAFLNDELMIAYFDENNNDIDTYIVETVLQQGWNRVLIKCGYSEIERCNFALRVTDRNGFAMDGLRISTEQQSYVSKPGAPVTVVENAAEAYFKQLISKVPDHLENYILLADTYLRNDKAVEAELALREASRRLPTCALFYDHQLEAYTRGEKFDEVATTREKLAGLDSKLPAVIAFRFSQYLENGRFDEAEALIKEAEVLRPDSEWVYGLYLALYGKKRLTDKLIELNHKAYERYPDNQTFATTEALLAIQITRRYDEAIAIFQRFARKSHDPNTLSGLARLYSQASDRENWQDTYQQIFALQPTNPVYYDQMAAAYLTEQDYASAEELLQKALKISPSNSDLLTKMGDIYRATNRTNDAKEAYRLALKYRPTNYAARRILRDLDGKPAIFSRFTQPDIGKLVASAPNADAYPNDSAVILLNDHKRVVYEGGASEYSADLLVRILNKSGIDAFHEYWIQYNGNTEELTLEKAVTRKKDGSEINADERGGHLVFKSLEVGDFIYIKYQVANYYEGRLSNQFWDTFYFSLFYPQRNVRYALLAPESLPFQRQTQRMSDQATVTPTPDGLLYEWKAENEPAVKQEADMPILDDIGKMLYISSISNWPFMVEWYQDLAQTKSRSSYEIKEQVAQLVGSKPNLSVEEKINRIYQFITENIRYSSVSFRQSGLIPQKARDVLVNRIGDCKDVATLGIAMLREAGVTAHYVLVNTNDEGNNRKALPSIVFNHCIAAVETETGLSYLDFTANNHPVGSAPAMDIDGFSLLIKPGVSQPEYLKRKDFMANTILREQKVVLRDDNSALLQVATTRTGNLAAAVRARYRDVGQDQRNQFLTETLSKDHANIKLLRFDLQNLTDLTPAVSYQYDYEAPGFVTDAAQFKLFMIPWADRLESYDAVSYASREYPIFRWTGADTVTENLFVTLPQGFAPLETTPPVRLTAPEADYTVQYEYLAGVLTARRQLIIKKSEVSPEDYAAFRKFYNALVKEDSRQILLKRLGD